MKTLKYGIKHLERADKAKDMPAAAEETALSIVQALDSFNYDGADPNLVLARTAALETTTSDLVDRVGSLEGGQASGYAKRNSAVVNVTSTTYTNLANAFTEIETSGGIEFVPAAGFRVPSTGTYRVHLTFMSQINGGGNLLASLASKTAPTTVDHLAMSSGANVQSLCAVTLDEDVDLVAGDILRPFGIAATGTSALSLTLGRFSIEKKN